MKVAATTAERPRIDDLAPSPTCPLCHTLDRTITPDALAAGAEWTCTRCGQAWDAARLATCAAYQHYLGAV